MKKTLLTLTILITLTLLACNPPKLPEELGASKTEQGSGTGAGADQELGTLNREEVLEELEKLPVGVASSQPDVIAEVSTQGQYVKEEEGGPARPSWNDFFRHYPEQAFFKNGRYVLSWTKNPGTNGNQAERWEVYQIDFIDYDKITSLTDSIDFDNVRSITKIMSSNETTTNADVAEPHKLNAYTETKSITLPTDLLPANADNSESSADYPAINMDVNNQTQVGYMAFNGTNRQKIVGYKVRLYTTKTDYDDHGNPFEVELYNDSVITMIEYKKGLYGQNTGAIIEGGGGGGATTIIPDKIGNISELRTELGYTSDQYFSAAWESTRIKDTANVPLTSLLTKADFDHLFPHRNDTDQPFHSAEQPDYYTYDNFVRAASYFPKFVGEGTEEDKYRELAAFLGHKSHEVGDGWDAANDDGSEAGRWSYGLVWIEELTHRNTTTPSYTQANATYPPTPGKSYHGRGPVQLSYNYNYGAMSEVLFGNKQILLDNPTLIIKDGVLGFASAIWFWMQPQAPKPSAHDVMIGNLNLDQDDVAIVDKSNYVFRNIESDSVGSFADGTAVDYSDASKYIIPGNGEVGFGLTINIINGGLEAGNSPFDGRQAKRIGYFARYLDYFGKTKMGLSQPLSPQVGGRGGDDVPAELIEHFKTWRTWKTAPLDVLGPNGEKIPSIIGANAQRPWA